MEQSYRFALWMFLLIGYLQANPLPSNTTGQCKNSDGQPWKFNMAEEPFTAIRDEVTCGENMKFISPPKEEKEHCQEALKCFMQGLLTAQQNCTGTENGTIYQGLDFLDEPHKTPISEECGKWENNGSYKKNFTQFTQDLENFCTWVNAQQ